MQWSSSLGRPGRGGWQNCSKKFRRLFNGYLPTYATKGHVCLCVYLSLFGMDIHFLYQISLLFSIFGNFEVDLRGFFMLWKFLKTLICSKYIQKLPKNSNLLQSIRMTMGVLSPPPTTVQSSPRPFLEISCNKQRWIPQKKNYF